MPKQLVGLVEKITLIGENSVSSYAVFDTGARLTSIDIRLAGKAKIGPIIRTTKVKNPSTKMKSYRPVVRIKVKIKGKIHECEANIQDRSHMTSPMIIGRNVLSGKFIVDPAKNHKIFRSMQKQKNSAEGMGMRSIDYFTNGEER